MAPNTRRRQIGGIGTVARVVLGLAFLLLGVTGGLWGSHIHRRAGYSE